MLLLLLLWLGLKLGQHSLREQLMVFNYGVQSLLINLSRISEEVLLLLLFLLFLYDLVHQRVDE